MALILIMDKTCQLTIDETLETWDQGVPGYKIVGFIPGYPGIYTLLALILNMDKTCQLTIDETLETETQVMIFWRANGATFIMLYDMLNDRIFFKDKRPVLLARLHVLKDVEDE